jgi:hypothetical protein
MSRIVISGTHLTNGIVPVLGLGVVAVLAWQCWYGPLPPGGLRIAPLALLLAGGALLGFSPALRAAGLRCAAVLWLFLPDVRAGGTAAPAAICTGPAWPKAMSFIGLYRTRPVPHGADHQQLAVREQDNAPSHFSRAAAGR